ncbi:MAG TPA: OsmC family peroxiredoxin [Gaiellaceae bacterium]|nr:OsmC family peroxiredoxin [Gaiellaceae bacterium]
MPRASREAEVVWQGSSAKGRGAIAAASSGAFAGLAYSEPARIGAPDGETSPEELIAAAHAACFAMSLAGELTRAKAPPEQLTVRAEVVIDEVEGSGHRIVSSSLTARARAQIGEDSFRAAVADADAGCPVSALIRGTATVSVDASLEGA